MAVIAPGRRPAYPPIGRLRTSPLSGGKKSGFVSLNLTAMVDMFTILVIFLIQLFKASGEVTLSDRIKIPTSISGAPLEEQGTVVQIMPTGEIIIDNKALSPEEMGTELDPLIPGVSAKLKALREFNEKTFGPRDPTKPYDGQLIVQADIKTDFKSVRRVIASANDAEWAKFKFVTMPAKKTEGEAEAAKP